MANITQGLEGLTFESVISPATRQANRLGILRDGDPDYYSNEPVNRFQRVLKDADYDDEIIKQIAAWEPSRNERMLGQQSAFLTGSLEDNIGLWAAESGLGESRFDKRMNFPSQLNDLEDARSHYQSTAGVIANSLAKMGTLAATTAADAWIGLPAGLINLASKTASGDVGSASEAFNAIVDNPVSSWLQQINERSEDVFQNYVSSEERNRPWWENMFTANFIGDTLIKNAGFTIGAAAGARVAVGAIGRMAKLNEARDAFKGLAAELGLGGKTASQVAEILKTGKSKLATEAAYKALVESAQKLKNAEIGLKIAGSLIAGSGEARIEALNGVSELEKSYDEMYGDIDIERAKALNSVKEEMVAKGIDINTPEGQKYFDEKKAIIDSNYVELQEQIAHDKVTAANTIFALNVPLLTFGDAIQWGKLMLGDYAIDRSIVNGIKKVAGGTAARSLGAAPKNLIENTRYAVKDTKLSNIFGKLAAGSKNVLVEMQEEMNQSFFSQTAKAKAMGSTTEFMERLYDPMAIHDTVTWLDAAKEGMRQSWLNKDDWVEGFAGGFMGFMGLPSISVKVDSKTGEKSKKLTMEGGIWSPLRERNYKVEQRKKLVDTLNNRLASPEFLNYYYGRIGNEHFDLIKEDAIASGDKGKYMKADHAQLINDAMMFSKAGRLQDFIDIVESFDNVTSEDIKSIKALFPEVSDVQKMTDSGMRTLIHDNVEKIKRQLNDYIKVSESLRTLYGNESDDHVIAEMTWQTAHLNEIEHDLKDILSHTETSSLLTKFKSEKQDKVNSLTDYEIVSSDLYSKWLAEKLADPKDDSDKSDVKTALEDAAMAKWDMSERIRYVDNMSLLTTDPSLIEERRRALLQNQAKLKRLMKLKDIMITISSTDRLSDFVSAMEEFGTIDNDTLAELNNFAKSGSKVAQEYIDTRNVDAQMGEAIRIESAKLNGTPEQVEQAKAAWEYFKHNSDTFFDLTEKHSADDIAPDVAGPEAIQILNNAVSSVLKNQDLYKRRAKRTIKKKESNDGMSGEEVSGTQAGPIVESKITKFKTTGKKLTEKWFKELVNSVRENARNESWKIKDSFIRINLEASGLRYGDNPTHGYIYICYPNKGKIGDNTMPVAFDYYGNEISPEEIKKLITEDGDNITQWYSKTNNINAYSLYKLPTDSRVDRNMMYFPIDGKAKSEQKEPQSGGGKAGKGGKKEGGNKAGSKSNPHKYFAPNPDIALSGTSGEAITKTLSELPVDSEVRFGIEEDGGTIFILAGPNNDKIGTLPQPSKDSEEYSGLSEFIELLRKEYSETKDNVNADGMWISEKYVNHIREKYASGFDTINDNVPLNEIPGFDGIKEPVFMLVTEDKDGIKYHTSKNIDLGSVLGINTRVPAAGYMYLLVPTAENRYLPVALFTGNISKETLESPTFAASDYGKRLNHAINECVRIITTLSGVSRKQAFEHDVLNGSNTREKENLQRLIYTSHRGEKIIQMYVPETARAKQKPWFDDNTVMIINIHNQKTDEDDYTPIKINQDISVRDQIIDALFTVEYETEDGRTNIGPLAQIHPVHFSNKDWLNSYVRALIDDGLLLANVKDFNVQIPSFTMDYWSVGSGKFIRPSETPMMKRGKKVVVKHRKSKSGTEKIVEFEIGGTAVSVNMNKLSGAGYKIGSGDWFSPVDKKEHEKEIKSLGLAKPEDFFDIARAIGKVQEKYGESEVGDDRIGDNILLRRFKKNKDYGFVYSEVSPRFMSPDELVEFKERLKDEKKKQGINKEAEKKKYLDELKAMAQKAAGEGVTQEPNDDDDDPSLDVPMVTSDEVTHREELDIMKTVSTVGEAILLLKKNAPQYSTILDYMSRVPFYNDMAVEFAKYVDINNPTTGGQNRLREDRGVFTNRIIIGDNAFGYHTLMHELVHAFTVVALRQDENLRQNVEGLMQYFEDTVGRTRLMNALGPIGMQAFDSPYEFVAEFFSNPKLQEIAKNAAAPASKEYEGKNAFSRFFHMILSKLKSLFRGKKHQSFYDEIERSLLSIIDRQAELESSGKMVFKSAEEFEKTRRFAGGASVNGFAYAMSVPLSEQRMDTAFIGNIYDDRSERVRELKSHVSDIDSAVSRIMRLGQLVSPGDMMYTKTNLERFLSRDDVYEFNAGTSSSLIGIKDRDVFVATRVIPITSDLSFDTLLKRVSITKMPIVIGANQEEVAYYEKFGLHKLNSEPIDGKIFIANKVFTNDDLFNLALTRPVFEEVIDTNSEFVEMRRLKYSDAEWSRMSEIEKAHARKCIGL